MGHHTGVSLIIRNDFEIIKMEEIHKGRFIKIECKHKATQTLYNIVGFYRFPSSWDRNVRKSLIQKLDSALSIEIINYILCDFNFTESQLDRNRPSMNTIKDDKSLNEIWENIIDKYELVNSFRALNPKLRRYSYVKNNAKSRIDRIYITETEGGKIQNTNFYKFPWNDHKTYELMIQILDLDKGAQCKPFERPNFYENFRKGMDRI